jgi:hypothetical protein
MKHYVLLLVLLLLSLSVESQTHDPTIVRFVNTGKMYVGENVQSSSSASLFIPDGVLVSDSSGIVQNGITAVGGNFYQNARTKAFVLGVDSFTVSTGTVQFMTNSLISPTVRREIAVWQGNSFIPAVYTVNDPSNVDFFVRGDYYIAFPNIEIATDDTIYLSEVMGIDAIDIRRTSGLGALYLESNPVGADQIFDASLRVTGSNVTEGSVIIEKYVLPFRDKGDGNAYLFPFASPYTNQRAGYFAGNWVRAPRADVSGHYVYPFANMKSTGGQDFIDESQYVRWAPDLLAAGAPYLLRLQPQGFAYDLPFVITGGEEHDLDKFVFNGTPHNLPTVAEQKMTGNVFSQSAANSVNAIQWLIGNSYTSAISIDSLYAAIDESLISFSKYLYIYPHGATTYEEYDLSIDYALGDIPNIPAMSVFMLIVSSGNTNTVQPFTITPSMQVHGKSFADDGSGPALVSAPPANRLTFRLTPEDNPFIYDQTRIVLHENGRAGVDVFDIAKTLNPTSDYFQFYGGSKERALAKNVLPPATEKALLLVRAPKNALSARLTVSGLETSTTEVLLLYDTKLNVWTDLLVVEDYVFLSEPNDDPERFVLYFQTPVGMESIETESLYAYCQGNYLYLNRLAETDKDSRLKIYNPSGLLMQETVIDSYPQYQTAVNIPQGVYIAKIEGERNAVLKFIKR